MYCRLLPTLSSNNLVARCLWSVVRLIWPQIPAQCHHAMLTACDGTSYCSANPTAVERPSSASWNLHVIVQSYDHVGSVVICSFKCGWFTRPTRRVPALQITLPFDLVISALLHDRTFLPDPVSSHITNSSHENWYFLSAQACKNFCISTR